MSEPTPPTPRSRFACPRCGKSPRLRWTYLLPSNTRGRVLKCEACAGGYDLADNTKIAGLMGGLFGLGPAILLFGRVIKAGHGSTPSVIAGTGVIIAGFAIGSLLVTLLSFRLVSKG